MQCLTKKNTQLSQELEECKAQLEAALATSENVKGMPAGNICFERYLRFEMWQATLTIIMQMRPEQIRTSNNSYAN